MTGVPAVWFPAIKAGTGADVFTQRLCDGLREKGIRAEIAWLPRRAEYLPWTVAVPELPSWANVVHVNTWLHRRFIPDHLLVLATMHLCVHDPVLTPYKSWGQALYHHHWVKPLEAASLRRADCVVAVSHYTAERTKTAFGIDDVAVIYNGVPIPDDVVHLPERAPHLPFRLLYVGNWSRRKGTDLLGPVMQTLGDGFELWYTADAHGAHKDAVLPSNCKCIGRLHQQQLRKAYRDVDGLVFPTRLEGFGLVAAEAMANGLPVVATRSSSLPEIVDHGKTGWLCAENDVAAFAKAIRSFVEDETGWRQMAEASRTRIHRDFSEGRQIDAYLRIYKSLLLRAEKSNRGSSDST